MGVTAYYNENDPYAAQWLRNLVDGGHIARGYVDERDINDVDARELAGFTQHHFFAGLGGWSYALRLAGWPDDRPIWTGSCPCQPFSGAGKRKGRADERHLWPVWYRLIRECRPGIILGEQVASPDALDWLDHVHTDMEEAAHAFAAVDFCAAGIGAPHWRQRLYWLAHTNGSARRQGGAVDPGGNHRSDAFARPRLGGDSGAGELAVANGYRRNQTGLGHTAAGHDGFVRNGTPGQLAIAGGSGLPAREHQELSRARWPMPGRAAQQRGGASDARPGPVNGFWSDADWLLCTDGKWRPVEPGTFPLAHGVPGRVGLLRGYGNAIVPQLAAEFVAAYMEARALH
jgi:DNA (cytosine-5)-methyltransferase 1